MSEERCQTMSSTIPLLSVSPIPEDHVLLEKIFSDHAHWIFDADCDWTLHRSLTLESASTTLQEQRVPIVVGGVLPDKLLNNFINVGIPSEVEQPCRIFFADCQ